MQYLAAMKLTTIPLLSLALHAHATTIPPAHKNDSFNWRRTQSLIAFGDSYNYIQGAHGHQNYSFINDELNLAFTPAQLFANRIVQNLTGTAEGGPNWVEYLTNCVMENGLHDPRKCNVQLWDFA